MYLFVDLKIEHVAVMMRTWNFYTAEIIPFDTWRAGQKCKKSKAEGLGCLRVATVAFLDTPPKKLPLRGARMTKFDVFRKTLSCVF